MRKSIIIALVFSCNSLAGLVHYLPPTDQNIPVILPSGAEVRIVGVHAEELIDLLDAEELLDLLGSTAVYYVSNLES